MGFVFWNKSFCAGLVSLIWVRSSAQGESEIQAIQEEWQDDQDGDPTEAISEKDWDHSR